MSVMGYFARLKAELRMPKGEDSRGIRFRGPVLSGQMSLELAQLLEAAKERQRRPVCAEKGEEWYARPDDYDPVLRAHCGMKLDGEET